MPLHRRNSTGQVEGDYLEEITEAAELEEDHLHEITCSAPKVLHPSSIIESQLNISGLFIGFLVSPWSSGRTHLRRLQNCQVDLQQQRLHSQSVYALGLL